MMARMQTIAPPSAPATQSPGTPQAGRWMQTVHADVTVPFEASAITGGMITSIVLLLAGIVIYWQRWLLSDVVIPLALAALGLWLSTTLVFWFLERRDIKTTWWRAEERDQVDYTDDNMLGRPGPDAIQVRSWRDDMPKQTAEELRQQRFEIFIASLYQTGKTDTETIRALPARFTEPERAKFLKALREARLIEAEHSGKSAGWTFIPPDAQTCVKLARQRVIWLDRTSSSSSSRQE